MATASVTTTFVNGTTADASQVNTNFNDLVSFLNGSVVHVDGSKAFTAPVTGVAPTADLHLATKKYVDDSVVECLVSRAASGNIPSDTETAIIWDTEAFDPNGWHDLVTNPERITVPAGLYLVTASVTWDNTNGTSGHRRLKAVVNESGWSTVAEEQVSSTGSASFVNAQVVTGVWRIVSGGYFQFQVYQNSGSTLALFGSPYTLRAGVIRLGA